MVRGEKVIMIGRRALSLALGIGVAGAVILTTPVAASASTYEWNTAVPGSVPSGLPCIDRAGAKACFQADGDKLWVKDTSADGHSATASWEEWWQALDSSVARQGSCVNKLGAGTWGVCNKDFPEGDTIKFSACVYDSADGTWHGCSGSKVALVS
jgi:hypothetical protein